MSPDYDQGVKTARHIMTIDDDKATSDDIKVPKFDHSNKAVSRDSKIKAYAQSCKCAALAKYGTKGGVLFQPLAITKPGAIPPSLHFAKKSKIDKVAPAFHKMVPDNDVETWFKMQVWVLQFLIRDFTLIVGYTNNGYIQSV